MARYTGAVCRQCRRAGEKLFLKGERCYTPKCAVEKRRKTPGDHQPRRRRASEWGTQLREKQKARQMYGVLERQFRTYFAHAHKIQGATGSNLLQLLERRLDNVVYRVGFADSRAQARQYVLHGHFTVNGRKVSIPSYRVRVGEQVAWKGASKEKPFSQDASRTVGQRPIPAWIDVDKNALTAVISRNPEAEDIDSKLDTRMIVEFYSR
ncbi:MAG: 30S ribosomal protein S4 [Dehalococcoidia bacterium]